MDVNDLSFPVVLLCEDKTISMPVDAEELSACSPLGMRILTGATVIDLSGAKCVITTATKVKTTKPWWRPPLFVTVITAELSLKHVETLSLVELKKMLVKGLKRSGWGADNGSLIPGVNRATSLGDIRAIFSPEVCSVPRWFDFSQKKGKLGSAVTPGLTLWCKPMG
jgi:hypothetical protein